MVSKRRTSRRQFLQGQSALEALADLAQGEPPPVAPQPPADRSKSSGRASGPRAGPESAYLVQIARSAMACQFQIYLNAGQHARATESALEALDLIEALEDQMTVFRAHSEVSAINQRAARRAVRLEPQLFDLLEQAAALHRATEGAFDVTSGPLWRLWGFHRRAGRFPAAAEIEEVLQRVGGQWMELNRDALTVRFRKPGLEINLGGIGKGYALDRSARVLGEAGVENFLIHGGQSSILARGSRAGLPEQRGWSVALRHPLRPDQRLAEIWLRDRALGTAGSGTQFFYYKGRRYGHILDPRSGRSAEGLLSATVLAPTAAMADALSTAFYVMGVEKSLQFCRAHGELAAILISPGARSGAVGVESIGLNDSDWKRLDLPGA